MIDNDSLGEGWTNLVQAWTRFEDTSTHVRGSLSAKGRPAAVADWIQRARNPGYRPIIKDSRAFGDKHVTWWASLQPQWRVLHNDDLERNDKINDDDGEPVEDGEFVEAADLISNGAGLNCDGDGDFEELRKPGVNGLLSVLASLYFWGMAVKDSGKKSKKWVQSVEDCTYVLRSLSAPVPA